MNITILCIGKLKEPYWTQAMAEYEKRLSRYCTFTVEELKEERLAENPSDADRLAVKEGEGRSILKRLKAGDYVIALEIQGRELSSEQFTEKLETLGLEGKSSVTFVIGGSLGLSQEVLTKADFRLSFSKMTFPHQLMRVILAEQIYRCFKIMRNESYHK